jgi:RNA polymerase sigma-70 factor (ECF subfamily)
VAQVAWLWRVARNKAVDAFRKAAFRRNVSLEQVSQTMYEDEARDPEQVALRQVEVDEIHDLVCTLPEAQREIIQLRFAYDLHCGEIAAILDKREDTVRTMLSRTMNSLRRLYAQRPSTAQDSTPDKGDEAMQKK